MTLFRVARGSSPQVYWAHMGGFTPHSQSRVGGGRHEVGGGRHIKFVPNKVGGASLLCKLFVDR